MTSPRGHFAIAGAIIFAVLVAGWMGRYSFVTREGGATAIILDRWSGDIRACSPAACSPVIRIR